MIKKLIREGYVTKNKEHFLDLTPQGTAIAKAILKRNQTIYELLVCLGVNEETAETDACKKVLLWFHIKSKIVYNRFILYRED